MRNRGPWLACFLCLLPAALHARGETPEATTRNPSFIEESDQFSYRVLEDDHGGFYAVWTHQRAGECDLIAQHVNPKGDALWSTPGVMVVSAVNGLENWNALPDGKGGLLLVWMDAHHRHDRLKDDRFADGHRHLDETDGEGHVRAQRFSPGGKAFWPDHLTVTTSTRPASMPVGVADATGGAYFVWSEKRNPDRWSVMSQRLSSDGSSPWTPEGLRVSLRPSDQQHPQVVYDGESGYVVAWRDTREHASQLLAQRLDFQGNRYWGQEGVVVTAPAGRADEPVLLQPLGGGSAVVGWVGTARNVTRLFLQSLDSQGHFRWAPEGINFSYGNWDQWNPILLGGDRGQLWAGWEDFRNHSHWQVFVGNMDAQAHQTWAGGEVPLSPVYGDQGHMALSDDGRGGVFAAWLDNRSGRLALYAQEVDAAGQLLLGDRGQAIVYSLVKPASPRLVPLAPGEVAIFWADHQKKNRWALYWTSFKGPKIKTPTSSASSLPPPTTDQIEPTPAGEGMPSQ